MESIPVVFGIDKTYVLQIFIVMHSILKNSNQEYYFIILTKDEVGTQTDEFSRCLKEHYSNFCYTVRKVEDDIFNDAPIHNIHIAQAAFYRLLIPELVPEYEKCIYLDADIIVNGNLEKLFNMDLGDNYIAGAKDCHIISKNITQHQKNLGIPSVENYINSGVLLMNLKKLREDNISKAFLQQAKEKNQYEDQDVLNLCCYDSIKVLPLEYNLFHFYCGKTINSLFNLGYEREEFIFNWSSPFILHMGGIYKPWLKKQYKGSAEWWRLAEIYKGTECYRLCRARCQEQYDDYKKISEIFKRTEGKHVILWGFSEQGRDVCDVFLRRGIAVYAFCDNDVRKKGKSYKDIPVLTVSEIIEAVSNVFWIITCKKAFHEIYSQLSDLKIKSENIEHFMYNNRGRMYYLALDPGFYSDELKVIALCEKDKSYLSDEQYFEYIQQIINEENINRSEYRYFYYKYRFDLWLKA